MGYGMSQDEAKFTIAKGKQAAALKSLKALAKSAKLTWVTTEDILKAKTLAAAMEELRWPVDEDEDGNITSINFEGEKAGDEMKFFAAIAEHVDDGCFIEMHGEDGSRWRWVFSGGKVAEKSPSVSWDG
jgi:hypothetical protein